MLLGAPGQLECSGEEKALLSLAVALASSSWALSNPSTSVAFEISLQDQSIPQDPELVFILGRF